MEPPDAAAAPPVAPYVGLRPYERHESDLLTGRATDARFLTDKVFSARLTLLYASSGLGKSSLLKALVIPELEREQCRTLYHDAWAGEAPETGVRRALSDMAASLGLRDVLRDDDTLVNLVRLVTADGRTLVLVLDQFEEFLLNHAQRLDPLRRELATLVRASDIDVRVVVALREEFLANLEPFREEMVNLFQSTYRLEPLDSNAVRTAIRGPARVFGVEYEDALLDQLVADLEARPATPAGGIRDVAADLPMLQTICLEMWKAASRQGRKTLSLDFYLKDLGGSQTILDKFVRKVMPPRWRDRLLSARLMTYLAPPSGLKISYAASDLAAMSGLDAARVASELHRLAGKDVRILRMREVEAGERFELQHDALIPRIAPWRDKVLSHHLIAKRIGFVGLGVLAALGVFAAKQVYDEHELRIYSDDRLAAMNCLQSQSIPPNAGSTFDAVAGYLLGHKRGEETWDRLRLLTQKYEECIPASYGIDTSGYELIQPVPPGREWPLQLRIAEARELDETAFLQAWSKSAVSLTGRWGVPIPRQVAVTRDPTFPRNLVRLESRGKSMVEMEVGEPTGLALVRLDKDVSVVSKAFHGRYRGEWKRWNEFVKEVPPGDWWIVPRWSLPAWTAAGVKAHPPSAMVALALQARLESVPDRLLTDGAAAYLVARVAETDPQVGCEVQKALGRGLARTLAKVVANGQGLKHLPLLFDALTGVRAERWPQVAETFERKDYLAALQLIPGETLSSADDRKTKCDSHAKKVEDPEFAAYREMEPWLPAIAPPVRLPIGDVLTRQWAPDGRSLAPQLQEAIGATRDRLYEQLGVFMPGIRLRGAGPGEPVGPREYRLGLLDHDEALATPKELTDEGVAGVDALLRELVPQLTAARAAWIRPEQVAALLESVSPDLKRWLTERYSVADLTLIMRAVVLPDTPDQSSRPAANQTLRHPEWLLGSLVFWDAAKGPRRVAEIAAFFRELQAARIANDSGTAPQSAGGPMPLAVDDLLHDRVQSAHRRLEDAVRTGGEQQVHSLFVRLYTAGHRESLITAVRSWCSTPTRPRHSNLDRVRADLQDVLRRGASALPRDVARTLELCRIASYPKYREAKQTFEAAALAAAGHPPDDWPAAQALWLGQTILKRYDPVRDPPRLRIDGATLFSSALPRLPGEEASAAFAALLSQCSDERKPNTWCWTLVEKVARQVQDPWIAIDMSNVLSGRTRSVGLQAALEWAAEGERRLKIAVVPKEDRERGLLWIRMLRANATLDAAEPGKADDLAQLELTFRQLLDSPDPFGEQARLGLTQLMLHKRRAWRDAEHSAREGMKNWPENAAFLAEAFLATLMQGSQEDVRKLLDEAETRALDSDVDGEMRDEFLFLAALGDLMTGTGRWELVGRQFLQTRHRYVNVIAIVLHNRMSGSGAALDAEALINGRWSRVERASWQRRMEEGDASAWPEVLLGFYLGHVSPDDILPILDDDVKFAASAFSRLPSARSELRSDAYFYDALRRQRQKDMEGMTRSLKRVVEMGGSDYYEYFMARRLLQ